MADGGNARLFRASKVPLISHQQAPSMSWPRELANATGLENILGTQAGLC